MAINQFKTSIGGQSFSEAQTELTPVPHYSVDPWDAPCAWLTAYIKSNPGVLVCYEKNGEYIQVVSVANHSKYFLKARIIDINGREKDKGIPKNTEFKVYLGILPPKIS